MIPWIIVALLESVVTIGVIMDVRTEINSKHIIIFYSTFRWGRKYKVWNNPFN